MTRSTNFRPVRQASNKSVDKGGNVELLKCAVKQSIQQIIRRLEGRRGSGEEEKGVEGEKK